MKHKILCTRKYSTLNIESFADDRQIGPVWLRLARLQKLNGERKYHFSYAKQNSKIFNANLIAKQTSRWSPVYNAIFTWILSHPKFQINQSFHASNIVHKEDNH